MSTQIRNMHALRFDAKPPNTSKNDYPMKKPDYGSFDAPKKQEHCCSDDEEDSGDENDGTVDEVKELLLSSVLQFAEESDRKELEQLCAVINKEGSDIRIMTDSLLDMYYARVEDHMPVEDIINKYLKGSDSNKPNVMETDSESGTVIRPQSSEKSGRELEKKKELKPELICKVCLDNQVAVTFVPCGHLVTCVSCTAALFECPVCRAQIRGTIRTYL